jgi:hypothetical protein
MIPPFSFHHLSVQITEDRLTIRLLNSLLEKF